MSASTIRIDESWKQLLMPEFEAPYFARLKEFLKAEYNSQHIYPPASLIFNAFDKTPVSKLKAVILGQDPYHGSNQAHGLSFSVQQGIKPPPSLINIFKELYNDIGFTIPAHGNLEKWALEGVLLLNTTLTVRASQPRSHFGKGWEQFTNAVISSISKNCNNIVFILWGSDAQQKEVLIDASKHCILKAAHPSPFSVYRGFYGCKHFSKTNAYLKSKGIDEINWSL